MTAKELQAKAEKDAIAAEEKARRTLEEICNKPRFYHEKGTNACIAIDWFLTAVQALKVYRKLHLVTAPSLLVDVCRTQGGKSYHVVISSRGDMTDTELRDTVIAFFATSLK